MRIGELRERITIQVRSRVSDDVGGFTESWATHAEVWAKVEPVSAAEQFFAQRLEEHVSHTVIIRYLSTVTSDMRISYRGRVLKIVGTINEMERRRFMKLKCMEGAGS